MLEGHPFRAPPARKLLSARIQPRISRASRFAGLGLAAAFWNAICGGMFVSAIRDGEGLFIVFLGMFMIIGAMLLGGAVHAFLALFNPTVELLASHEQPALGDTLELSWQLTGKARRVGVLEIGLEGVEEATYRRGTDTTTDRHTFVKLAVATTADEREIAAGTASVVIPRDAVPSFSAKNNKIVWKLTVRGEIPNWPDIDDEFALDVVANRRARAKAAA